MARYKLQGRARDTWGNTISGLDIYVYVAGTSRLQAATVYSSLTSTPGISATPQISSDSYGFFSFWVDDTDYVASTTKFDLYADGLEYTYVDVFNIKHHGTMGGLKFDDHPRYPSVSAAEVIPGNWTINGAWNFATPASGATPSAPAHLATKDYVDVTIAISAGDGLVESPAKVFNVNPGNGIEILFDAVVVKEDEITHANISGLGADDHTQYSRVDGTRAFTGVIGGITPVSSSDLATKSYVDTSVESISAGEGLIESPVNVLNVNPGLGIELVSDEVRVKQDEIDHTNIQNIGTNSHAQIDSSLASIEVSAAVLRLDIDTLDTTVSGHLASASVHFTQTDINHGNLQGLLDNDHPQYTNRTLDQSVSGDWEFIGEATFRDNTEFDGINQFDGDTTFNQDVTFNHNSWFNDDMTITSAATITYSTTVINEFSTDNTLAANSNNKLVTQRAIKTFVENEVLSVSAGAGLIEPINNVFAVNPDELSITIVNDKVILRPTIDTEHNFSLPVSGQDPTLDNHLTTKFYTDAASANALVQANSYTDAASANLITYADAASANALVQANSYTDAASANLITYADAASANALFQANSYTDAASANLITYADAASANALFQANSYTDAASANALFQANSYTDAASANLITYTDAASANALFQANSYTDAASANLITYADAASANALFQANSYTDAASANALFQANNYTDVQVLSVSASVAADYLRQDGTTPLEGNWDTGPYNITVGGDVHISGSLYTSGASIYTTSIHPLTTSAAAIILTDGGPVELYYDGVKVFETYTSVDYEGILLSDSASNTLSITQDVFGHIYIENNNINGRFRVYGNVAGPTQHSLIESTPQGGTDLYYFGLKKFGTRDNGIEIFNGNSAEYHTRIYQSAADLYIRNMEEGGRIFLDSTTSSSQRNMAIFDPDGSVELYYAGNKVFETTENGFTVTTSAGATKFETTETGAELTGDLYLTGSLYTSGASVYTSAIHPLTSPSAAIAIMDGGSVELYYAGVKTIETAAGQVNIYDSAGTNYTKMQHAGNFIIDNQEDGGNIFLRTGGETGITVSDDNAVYLYFNGVQEFQTIGGGVNVINGVLRVSNSGNHGALWHDASDLRVLNQLHGGLTKLQAENSGGGIVELVVGDPDGSVDLYYAGNKVAETTENGFTVTTSAGANVATFSDDGCNLYDENGSVRLGMNSDGPWIGQLNYAGVQTISSVAGVDIWTGTNHNMRFGASGADYTITPYGAAGAAGAIILKPMNGSQSPIVAASFSNSSQELYYDGSKKFETTSTGASITGDLEYLNISTVTSATTASNSDVILASGGPYTVSLEEKDRAIIRVKYIDSGNTITVEGLSGTIDGAANTTLTSQYESKTFVCDGSDWYII